MSFEEHGNLILSDLTLGHSQDKFNECVLFSLDLVTVEIEEN